MMTFFRNLFAWRIATSNRRAGFLSRLFRLGVASKVGRMPLLGGTRRSYYGRSYVRRASPWWGVSRSVPWYGGTRGRVGLGSLLMLAVLGGLRRYRMRQVGVVGVDPTLTRPVDTLGSHVY